MPMVLYPHTEDISSGEFIERLEQLMEAAERYKAGVLEIAAKSAPGTSEVRHPAPKDIAIAYNWDALAAVLREVRELPEANKEAKEAKANYLAKLSEIYEVLRAAKMPKLEAVRLALMTEANQLKGGSATQVA